MNLEPLFRNMILMFRHQSRDRYVRRQRKWHRTVPCRVAWQVVGLLSSLTFTTAQAQFSPPSVIREDVIWSGQIEITADVIINGATVQVAPGALVRFVASARGSAPAIRLASDRPGEATTSPCAHLVFEGTPAQPIVVETPGGYPQGTIVCDTLACCAVTATHTTFRRLGEASAPQRAAPLDRPAILAVLTGAESDLWLEDCRFEACGPIRAECFGPSASVRIRRCKFERTLGETTLLVTGAGTGIKTLTGCHGDAGFRIESPQVLVRENVLAGPSAALTLPLESTEAITIDSNYIHCTTTKDQGRYALRCQAPSARVTGNILKGGTYVIETSPRRVDGNILIGIAGLEAGEGLPGGKAMSARATSTTHYLIAHLPPRAIITNNLLLGPAYATLVVDEQAEEPRIENNIFDGWNAARRAMHLNVLGGRKPARAILAHNIIARYPFSPVFDEAALAGTLARSEANLFAEVPDRAYERMPGIGNLGPTDRWVPTVADLEFEGAQSSQAALSMEEQLLTGKVSVSEVRKKWNDVYRPKPNSPVRAIGAGPEVQP